MRTILTIKEQNEFLSLNYQLKSIEHKWSCRGYGNSKLIDQHGHTLNKRSGCGYDRFGAVVGDFIADNFKKELHKLAKRECKGERLSCRKTSSKFYGLFYVYYYIYLFLFYIIIFLFISLYFYKKWF